VAQLCDHDIGIRRADKNIQAQEAQKGAGSQAVLQGCDLGTE
jgi:hypothetical protein